MRQVAHMFSATVFLMPFLAGQPISRSKILSSFEDNHRRIWAGEANLADNAGTGTAIGKNAMVYASR
jgi:hypothetical protein